MVLLSCFPGFSTVLPHSKEAEGSVPRLGAFLRGVRMFFLCGSSLGSTASTHSLKACT